MKERTRSSHRRGYTFREAFRRVLLRLLGATFWRCFGFIKAGADLGTLWRSEAPGSGGARIFGSWSVEALGVRKAPKAKLIVAFSFSR